MNEEQVPQTGLLVAMPALNEAGHVKSMIESIRACLGEDTHILVLDDGSTDDTANLARAAGAHVVSHSRTLGLGQSFRDILRFALKHRTRLLVTIDADQQFDPREIPLLINPIKEGRADFVAAQRFIPGQRRRPDNMSRVKYYGNLCMTSLVRRITGSDITDASSGFRAYSMEALLRLNLHGSFTYTQETFLDLATKNIAIEQVPVSVKYRKDRQSRVVGSIGRYAFRTIATILRTVRDHRPLLVFGLPSFIFCAAGLVAAAFIFTHYLNTGSFSPYIFVGMIGAYLFSLGVIFGIVGIASDMLRPIRRNQEDILYLLKKHYYYKE